MDRTIERLWGLFVPVLLATSCAYAEDLGVGWLISNDNYGMEEARCFQAAAEIAYAEVEASKWNFWLNSQAEPSEIAVDQESTPSELDKFKKLFSSGVRKFVGPSVLGQAEIFDELRKNSSEYHGVELYAPLPLLQVDPLAVSFVKRQVPSWEKHQETLLQKFAQYSQQVPEGVTFSIIPAAGLSGQDEKSLNATWEKMLAETDLSKRSEFRVLEPHLTIENPNGFLLALREAIDLGSQPHIVVLDSGVVSIIRFLAAHIRPRLRKSSIHIHAVAAMNYQEDVAAILENLDNLILHTVEYVGDEWHSPQRRQFFKKIRGRVSERAYGHLHCPPATSAVYDAFMAATGGQTIDTSSLASTNATSEPMIVQAFFQPDSLAKRSAPLVYALQESPWIWDGPVKLQSNADADGLMQNRLPSQPSAEIIPKPTIKAIFRSKLGRECLDTEVTFNSYDPWQFNLVQEAYTIPGLPYMVILANIWGFWVDFKCYNETSVSGYTLACSPKTDTRNSSQQPSGGVDVATNVFNHCTEKFFVEDAPSEAPSSDPVEDWSSRQAKLLNKVQSVLAASSGKTLIRRKRHDLYSMSWLYEILHRQPGQIAPILAEIAPNIMSCFGVLLGCMNCVMIRNVFDRTGIGCMVPCASNQGHACGNAWGNFLSTHLKSRSVICTELFVQGRIDVETFLADARFGAALEDKDPLVLKGYRLLAAPAVKAAQNSPTFASLLNYVVQPWMDFMKYEQGLIEKQSVASVAGNFLTTVGKPVCRLAGTIHSYVYSFSFLSPL